MAAAMIGSAAFFAPLQRTSPYKAVPPVIWNCDMSIRIFSAAIVLGRVKDANRPFVGWVERSDDPPSLLGTENFGGSSLRSTHPPYAADGLPKAGCWGKPCKMPVLPPVKKFVSQTGVRIYRIPCQVLPALSARVYLLLGAGPPTLVDTGSGLEMSTRHILAGVETVRREFNEPIHLGDIGRIMISHGHTDHVGGLPDLLPLTAAQVAIHPLDREVITSNREFARGSANSRFSAASRRRSGPAGSTDEPFATDRKGHRRREGGMGAS